MLLANYLDKLNSEFRIQRLLCKYFSSRDYALPSTELFEVSISLLHCKLALDLATKLVRTMAFSRFFLLVCI